MAYINCKKCGCQMSDKSEACPMCGMPIGADVENYNKQSSEEPHKPENPVPNEQQIKAKEDAASTGYNAPTNTPSHITPSDKPAKKSNKTPIIIGIVAAVVVIAVLAVLFMMKGNKKSSQEILVEEAVINNDGNSTQCGNNDENASYNSNESKLKGYEWLEGVWAGADNYGNFGRMIVTDSYYQVVNSNMDDAFEKVEDKEKQDYVLKTRKNDYDGYDDDGEVFGFANSIGVDVKKQCIYIILGEYSALTLHRINSSSFESAVYEANHNYPIENEQDVSTESYQQNKSNESRSVVIDGSRLRLRLGPSTSSDTFKWPDGTNRHPNVGDKFKYLGESGDFYKIDFNGNELWVSKQFSHIE